MLRNTDRLLLKPNWILRREESESVLYEMSFKNLNYYHLTPPTAITLALCDGRSTVSELTKSLTNVFRMSSKTGAMRFLNNLVTHLNKKHSVITCAPETTTREDLEPLDHVIQKSVFKAKHRLSSPIRMMVLPTGKCQTNCRYCYSDVTNLRQLPEMDLKSWMAILDDIQDNDVRILDLSGGDPFARKDAKEFIAELIRRDFLFLASTKCHITEEMAETWLNTGFLEPVDSVQREFQISVDTMDIRLGAFLTGIANYPERAIESCANLVSAGIIPKIKAVITAYNLTAPRKLVETFAKMGVREFNFSQYSRSFHRHSGDFLVSEDQREAFLEDLGILKQEYSDLVIDGDAPYYQEEKNRESADSGLFLENRLSSWREMAQCSAGRTTLGVAPDGRAVLCEEMVVKEPYIFGNLREQSLMDVWNSKELNDICFPDRKVFAGQVCYECDLFEECVHEKGQCFRDNYFDYNGEAFRPTRVCPYGYFAQ